MKTKALLCSIALLLLGACDGSVEGDVFVVKGNGVIAVSPGREVRFVPVGSEEALFLDASASGAARALASMQDKVGLLCSVAVLAAQDKVATLGSQVSTIESRQSIPEGGCSGLTDESVRISSTAESTRNKQASELKKLEAELTAAKKAKTDKIRKIAANLKSDALKKVVVTFRTLDDYIHKGLWTIINNSEFCISSTKSRYEFTVKALVNGVFLSSETFNVFDPPKDKFGFKKGACLILAGARFSEKTYGGSLPLLKTPEQKVLQSQGKLKTFRCYSKGVKMSTCIVHDEIRMESDITFHTVKRKESGTSVTYDTPAVDWRARAAKSQSFASFDSRIKNAKTALAAAKSRHESNSSVAAADAARGKLEQCVSDSAMLAKLNPTISGSNALLTEVASCNAAPAEIASGLAALNSLLGLELDIPDGEKPYKKGFRERVSEIVYGDSSIVAETSIKGHYKIESISSGEYLVIAEYMDSFVEGFWMNAVTIKSGEQIVDLTQNSFVSWPLGLYLEVASRCGSSCIDAEQEMPSRARLVDHLAAKAAWEKIVKETLQD